MLYTEIKRKWKNQQPPVTLAQDLWAVCTLTAKLDYWLLPGDPSLVRRALMAQVRDPGLESWVVAGLCIKIHIFYIMLYFRWHRILHPI